MKSVRTAPGDLLLLDFGSFERQRLVLAGVVGVRADRFPHLLRAFEAEIGGAEHQQRRDRPGGKGAEQQRDRQQDEQLVA
jgi:hypothetical protein